MSTILRHHRTAPFTAIPRPLRYKPTIQGKKDRNDLQLPRRPYLNSIYHVWSVKIWRELKLTEMQRIIFLLLHSHLLIYQMSLFPRNLWRFLSIFIVSLAIYYALHYVATVFRSYNYWSLCFTFYLFQKIP